MTSFADAAPSPKAKDYLTIESIRVSTESNNTVDVILRNVSDRIVTAWCLDVSGGASDAAKPFHETHREDHYAQLDAKGSSTPLKPGQSTVRQFSYPGLDFSEDRFDDGDFSVLSVQVSCVFIDNGDSLGHNADAIHKIQLRRLAELRAALRFQKDFEAKNGDPLAALAWFEELKASRRAEDSRPVVLHRPSALLRIDTREQRSYRSLAYYTASQALWLYEDKALTASEVLERVATDIERTTANGLRNLPRPLRSEVQ